MPSSRGPSALRVLALLLAVALLVPLGPVAVAGNHAPEPTRDYAPGEVLVKWAPGTRGQDRAGTRAENQLTHKQTLPLGGVEVAGIPGNRNPVAESARLTRNPNVEYAEPNWLLEPAVDLPDDPNFWRQWGLHNTSTPGVDVGAVDAWTGSTGHEVLVAVIDSGTQIDHPDLAENIALGGQSWGNPDVSGPAPGHSHGTHVSGTVAAVTDNGIGVAGVAPDAKVLPLTFMWESDGRTGGSTSDAITAIDYAKAQGAKIANASWGSSWSNPALRDAISASGMVFVAAAGNDGADVDSTPFYPCAYDLQNVICVAAVDAAGALSDWIGSSASNYGADRVHLGAPGTSIYSTRPNGSYGHASGTSMAAPHVSGVAALVASLYPDLTAIEIVEHLKGTTTELESLDGKTATGGMVSAANAVLPVSLSSTDVAFPLTGVGLESVESVTVTNRGPVVLHISEATATGAFSLAETACSGPLEPGEDCIVDVTFTPTAADEYDGTLTVTHDGAGAPVTVTLSGAGALPGTPHHFTVSAEDPEAGKTVTVEAQLRDPFGDEIEEDGHEVRWTSSRGSMSASTSFTEGDGVASVEHTADFEAGETLLTATDEEDNSITGSVSITVQPGAPDAYAVSVSSTSPKTGAKVTVQAQLRDAHGNAVPQSGSDVAWSSTGGGSFSPTESATNSDGRASTSFTVSTSSGTTHVVSVVDENDLEGSSPTITVQASGGGGFGGGGGLTEPEPEPEPENTVPAGGTATTDPDGTGATATNPVQASVKTPTGGVVEIQAVKEPASGPSGFTMLPVRVDISAPPATPGDPLQLTFLLDPSLEVDFDEVSVFRNGSLVQDCTGSDVADPDPCVADRGLAGDDLELVVLSSRASVWGFGVPDLPEQQPAYVPPSGCPIPAPSAGFVDVHSASPHARSVDCVVWWDVGRGTSATTFSPAGQVTRAQMASFLARTVDEVGTDLPPAGRQFSDVDGVHADAVNRLAAVGIVRGTGPGTYQPNAPVTREQMATFLVRAYEHITETSLPAGTPRFTDVSASVHRDAINKAAEAGFTTGRTATTYAPRDLVRRDQMASFLYRVLDALAR